MLDHTLNMSWFYYECQHVKGPMDGLGGTEKNIVFRDSESGKCAINSPKKFAKYANKRVESITTLYLPECKLFVESNEVAKAPKIPQTLQVQKVITHMSKNAILYLQFSIWPLMKNFSSHNTMRRRVIQKFVATKEWM